MLLCCCPHICRYQPPGSDSRSKVAIKRLKPELYNTDELQLFAQEVQLMRKLSHRWAVIMHHAWTVQQGCAGASCHTGGQSSCMIQQGCVGASCHTGGQSSCMIQQGCVGASCHTGGQSSCMMQHAVLAPAVTQVGTAPAVTQVGSHHA
jgi:serine/threonine protein kinase